LQPGAPNGPMASDRRLPSSRALYDVQAGQQAVAHDDIERDDQPSSPSMTRQALFVIPQRVVQQVQPLEAAHQVIRGAP
jgi:hypothetical protein